jgi:hypothetical protein
MKDPSKPRNGKSAFGEALSPKGSLELGHKYRIVTAGVKSLTFFGPGWHVSGEQEAQEFVRDCMTFYERTRHCDHLIRMHVRTLIEASHVARMLCLGCFTLGEN